jgi:hypothetical protein
MWFIIAGTKSVERTIASGSFFCPCCEAETPFVRRKVTNYLTLFFIPLIPLGQAGQVVRCERCVTSFDAGILGSRPAQHQLQPAPWRCQQCHNMNPHEYTACVSCNAPRAGSSGKPGA